MRMNKGLIVGIVVGAVVLVALVAYLRRGTDTPVSSSVQVNTPVQGEVVPFEKSGISARALKSTSKDEAGIVTVLSHAYKEGMPLVEMSFLQRTLDGSIKPIELGAVELLASTPGHGATVELQGAHGLRKVVNPDPRDERGLLPGEIYKVSTEWHFRKLQLMDR